MPHILSRRLILQTGATAAFIGCTPAAQQSTPRAVLPPSGSLLQALEERAGGRLGVSFFVPSTGARLSNRGEERFGMASSFKLALAGIILKETDAGRLSLDTMIPFTRADIVNHSPIVTESLDKGQLSIEALARGTQTTSDNAAANLLLRQIGGPAGFTAKMRAIGDSTTRLDRMEPMMNGVAPGQEDDTTSPEAMTATVAKMVLGDYLSPASREKLIAWMIETRTGMKRIRAGLPSQWKAGDKTGTAMPSNPEMPDRYNDVAVVWPDTGPPMVIAAYYEPAAKSADMRDEDQAVLAVVGTIAASWYRALRL